MVNGKTDSMVLWLGESPNIGSISPTKKASRVSDFVPRSEPVTVTTFGEIVNGECENIYYIIKLTAENVFLRSTYRPLWKKSWTRKVSHAVLFQELSHAMEFATKNFETVTQLL